MAASTSASSPSPKNSGATPMRSDCGRRVERRRVVGHGLVDAGGVGRIVAGDHLQQKCGVGQVVGERADLVERAGEGDQAVATDPAVGRLEPDDAAEAAGWRIEPPVSVPSASGARLGGHRRRRAAGGAARYARLVPGLRVGP